MATFDKQWWAKNMANTICENMLPFMFLYLKQIERNRDVNTQTSGHRRLSKNSLKNMIVDSRWYCYYTDSWEDL